MQPSPVKFIGSVCSGLSCLYLAYALIGVWLEPMNWDNGHWVRFGVGLLLLEFLLLHSAAMFAAVAQSDKPPQAKRRHMLLMSGMYLLMCLGFSLAMDSFTLLAILGTVTVSRVVTTLVGEQQTGMPKRAAYGTVVYLLCVGLTVVTEFPQMGITKEVLDAVYPTRGGGLWERYPQNAIVGGALYFGIMGLLEIFVWSRSPEDTVPFQST